MLAISAYASGLHDFDGALHALEEDLHLVLRMETPCKIDPKLEERSSKELLQMAIGRSCLNDFVQPLNPSFSDDLDSIHVYP